MNLRKFAKEIHASVFSSKAAIRRRDHQQRFELYTDEFEQAIAEYLNRVAPVTAREFQKLWINVYRKTVDMRAGRFYRNPPGRTLELEGSAVDAAEQDRVWRVLDLQRFNDAMDKIARYTFSHRTLAVAVNWRHNRAEIDTLIPTLFDVAVGQPDPTSLEDARAFVQLLPDRRLRVWVRNADVITDAPCYFETDPSGNVDAESVQPIPYYVPADLRLEGAEAFAPVYPFALLQYESPDECVWVPGGKDLVAAALHVAWTLTDSAFVERWQSFGQAVFTGMSNEAARSLVLSPSEGIGLSQGQDMKFVAPPSSSADRYGALSNFLTYFANAQDIPIEVLVPGATPESGIAKRIRAVPLLEQRSSYAKRLAMLESQVFETWRAVHNTYCAEADRIPWEYRLRTVFPPQAQYFDQAEQQAFDKDRVANGLDSYPAILAREQGISIQEAIERINENKAQQAAVSGAPVQQPAAGNVAQAGAQVANPNPIGASLRERMAQRMAAAQSATSTQAKPQDNGGNQ